MADRQTARRPVRRAVLDEIVGHIAETGCRLPQRPGRNVICLRKVGKYLSTSVYEQVKWAIYKLGAQGEFHFGKSPLKITHKATGRPFTSLASTILKN